MAGLEGLDDNVCDRNEPLKHRAVLGHFQIEDDTALVRVQVEPVETPVSALLIAVERRQVPDGVAARRLDLDDVGAQVCEQLRAVLADLSREVEHADIVESAGAVSQSHGANYSEAATAHKQIRFSR